MNVSLTPELESIIKAKVESGMYNSASEVVRESIRLLQDRDDFRQMKLERLRADIQKGIDDMEAGRYRDGKEVMSELRGRILSMKQNDGQLRDHPTSRRRYR